MWLGKAFHLFLISVVVLGAVEVAFTAARLSVSTVSLLESVPKEWGHSLYPAYAILIAYGVILAVSGSAIATSALFPSQKVRLHVLVRMLSGVSVLCCVAHIIYWVSVDPTQADDFGVTLAGFANVLLTVPFLMILVVACNTALERFAPGASNAL